MIKIIQASKRETVTYWEREYVDRTDTNCGYVFPCDANGNLEIWNEMAWANHSMVVGNPQYADMGPRLHSHSYNVPAVGECSCGRKVILDCFTNECECGLLYNSFGQSLNPRSQWGDETGETF